MNALRLADYLNYGISAEVATLYDQPNMYALTTMFIRSLLSTHLALYAINFASNLELGVHAAVMKPLNILQVLPQMEHQLLLIDLCLYELLQGSKAMQSIL